MKKTLRVVLITLAILAVAVSCFAFTAFATSNDGQEATEPRAERLVGDLDGDGKLSIKDVIVLRRAIAKHDYDSGKALQVEGGDINNDGVVDIIDLDLLRKDFSMQDFYDDEIAELGLLELNNGIVLRAREDGSFRVLLISDVQCYTPEGIKNSGTLDVIEAMLEENDPDLVLFVGDNSWSCNTAEKMRAYLDVMVGPIEDREIPWAHIYGNHDAENQQYYQAISKEAQQEIYESYDHCVSKSGPENLPGVGNYVLPVLAHDSDKIVFNIWGLDSLMYTEANPAPDNVVVGGNTFVGKYEGMKEEQVEWYEETSKLLERYNGGEKIPALMYFHIPVQESYYAWADAVSGGLNGASNLTGTKGENISCPITNPGLFDAVVRRGDVKVIANGHDHVNDFSVDYKGVTLAYCGSAGIEEYHNYNIVGARVVDFSADGNVSTYMSYMKDIPEYSNETPIINMVIDKNSVTNGATQNGRFELVSHDYSSNPKSIVYDNTLGRYVVKFTGGSATPSVYNYSATNITPILADGFSVEFVFKLDSVPSSGSVGIVDFAELGGFCITAQAVSGNSKQFTLNAEMSTGPKTSDTNTSKAWHKDSVTLNIGEWYHVVYSYNLVGKTSASNNTRSTALYVNGFKKAGIDSLSRSNLYRMPTFSGRAGEEYICIGGCSQAWLSSGVKSQGINGMTGSIALLNLLPAPTDANAAMELYYDFAGENVVIPPILDLQINEDGTVKNVADGRPELNSYDQAGGGTKKVELDSNLNKYVLSFVGDNSKPSTYTLHASEFDSAFEDGFSYEVMFKITDVSKITNYHGILDYEEGGGFGLNVHKPTSGAAGKFKLETEVAVGSGWKADFVEELDLNTWYHCVFVYDGSSTAVYINGEYVTGTNGLTENYRNPSFSQSVTDYISIGGCAQSTSGTPNPNAGTNGMTGSIAIARIFCDPITAEDAQALYSAAIAK